MGVVLDGSGTQWELYSMGVVLNGIVGALCASPLRSHSWPDCGSGLWKFELMLSTMRDHYYGLFPVSSGPFTMVVSPVS